VKGLSKRINNIKEKATGAPPGSQTARGQKSSYEQIEVTEGKKGNINPILTLFRLKGRPDYSRLHLVGGILICPPRPI
jgi:hypothetical protein